MFEVLSYNDRQTNIALQNVVSISKNSHKLLGDYVCLNEFVCKTFIDDSIKDDGGFKFKTPQVRLNGIYRKHFNISMTDTIDLKPFVDKCDPIKNLDIDIGFLNNNRANNTIYNVEYIKLIIWKNLAGNILKVDQVYILVQGEDYFLIKIKNIQTTNRSTVGLYVNEAAINVESSKVYPVKLKHDYVEEAIFKYKDINFESIGIGGVNLQFNEMLRRVFASRMLNHKLVKKFGIKHEKGMILYGAPGLGKTLLARSIAKMLNTRPPKIVNGPEILNKYVGQSEENIRELFKDAEDEYKDKGDESSLHIIIFDEIDAICKHRSSSSSNAGVNSNIVNQLLTKMDGIDALNNILVIGMTNRLDLIDEALLRPGRFGFHLELTLPDEPGRHQIFKIHTSNIRLNKLISDDVDLEELARLTKNYTGAEIEAVVQSASSYTIMRKVNLDDINTNIENIDDKITPTDFKNALNEVKPAFGLKKDEFVQIDHVVKYNDQYIKTINQLDGALSQLKNSSNINILSFLIEGDIGSGKTTLAANIALNSMFPFVKCISPSVLLSFNNEYSKCEYITKTFLDSYKSPLSIIVLDNIEALVEYVDIGPRFSNILLQKIITLLTNPPPTNSKLMIIGTSSSGKILNRLGIANLFSDIIHMPNLNKDDSIKLISDVTKHTIKDTKNIPDNITIKDIMLIIDKMLYNSNNNFDTYITEHKIRNELLASYNEFKDLI